jgi:hypothetical protein
MSQWTVTEYSENEYVRGPHTPAARFFKAYGDAIDAAEYNEGVGERFYSSTVVYHIQNNAEYHGATQTWNGSDSYSSTSKHSSIKSTWPEKSPGPTGRTHWIYE